MFMSKGDFVPQAVGTLSGDILIVPVWGEGRHPWCLVIKGQGCHSTPYNVFLKTLTWTGQPPTAKTKSIQNASGVQAEKLWFMVSRSTLSLKISVRNCDEVG